MDNREINLREYANQFWTELSQALWVTTPTLEYLPILFALPHGEHGKEYGVTHTHINTKTNISSVYPVIYLHQNRTNEEIMATIRHEVIHYLLATQYVCHGDNSALFWLICDLFNGGAYCPMNEHNRKVYEIAKPYFEEIFKLYVESKGVSIAINISLMMTTVDVAISSEEENIDFRKLESDLHLCLNAAKQMTRNQRA